MADNAESLTATPITMLSVVLDAFTESARERVHPRIAETVRAFAGEEAETRLTGAPAMDATEALRRAIVTARDPLRRHLSKQGILLFTVDAVIVGMEWRVHYIAESGPVVDLPPDASDFLPPPPPLAT